MSAVFYIGDAIETMNKLPAGSVDLILTSPPFLALRSYLPGDHPDKAKEGGSQSTPGEFIDWLIDFAEASARVLAPHGSFCVELGDTYSGSGGGGGDYYEGGLREGQPGFTGSESASREALKEANAAHWRQKNPPKVRLRRPCEHGQYDSHRYVGFEIVNCPGGDFVDDNPRVQPWPLAKSLSLIPELFRLSLVYGFNPLTGRQTERWRLRNVVRWVRPNPPVGALGDKFRPATSELMVFCKSAKRYFDLDAVREPFQASTMDRNRHQGGGGGAATNGGQLDPGNRLPERTMTQAGAPPLDWWEIPPGGYEGSHYAVFPLELCVRPVKAMSPERVCKVCGEPSRRIAETINAHGSAAFWPPSKEFGKVRQRTDIVRPDVSDRLTLGFTDCGCCTAAKVPMFLRHCEDQSHWRPGLILDPFGGSGTVAAVATGHGRDCILIDLDARNFTLALDRVGPFMLTLGNIDEK